LIESKQEGGDDKNDNENGEETSIPMVIILALGAVDCGFQPMSRQTKDYPDQRLSNWYLLLLR
jgi:hypothetical protein